MVNGGSACDEAADVRCVGCAASRVPWTASVVVSQS